MFLFCTFLDNGANGIDISGNLTSTQWLFQNFTAMQKSSLKSVTQNLLKISLKEQQKYL